MKYDVFISYSRHDTGIAECICNAFKRAGISYFIDRQGVGGGFEFPVVLADAILSSRVILFLASENSYKSKFTNAELTFAFNEKPKNSILPYIIDGSQMPPALRFVFASINWRTLESHPIEPVLVGDILNLLGRNASQISTNSPQINNDNNEENIKTPLYADRKSWRLIQVAKEFGVGLTTIGDYCKTLGISIETSPNTLVSEELFNVLKMKFGNHSFEHKNARKILLDKISDKPPITTSTKTYKVGDFYDDGTKRGVVFAVSDGGRHGKIVSLEQSEQLWCTEEEYDRKIETGASDKVNGMNNQRKIQQISAWREKYPAFAHCANQGDGWYLPAIEELKIFTLDDAVHDAVNRTLETKGGAKLFDKKELGSYWSSTERDYKGNQGWRFCAWFVYMSIGLTSLNTKINDYYVRAVSAF